MDISINEIVHTTIVLNDEYITYSVLFQLSLTKYFPLPFASNLINKPKLRRFLIIGQQSKLCQHHIQKTIFNSKTGWIPYNIKLSHKSTGRFRTINQHH